MEKEYFSKTQMGPYSPVVVFAMLGVIPLVGVCLVFLACYVSYISYFRDGDSIVSTCTFFVYVSIVAVFLLWLGWTFICKGLAQYRFAEEGLYAKYPLRQESLVCWSEFQQVCICYAAYTTRGTPRANTVICCVKKNERPNGRGRWKTDNPFHYKTVICIDYRPSLVEGLKDVFPGDVLDLRDDPAYRF